MDFVCEYRSVCSYDECFDARCKGEVLIVSHSRRGDGKGDDDDGEGDGEDNSEGDNAAEPRRSWYHLLNAPEFITDQLRAMGLL